MRYWLVKTEPSVYSVDDLASDGATCWDGVRNYQARNFMRAMRIGDGVLIYHSNIKEPAVVGLAEVVREAYPDYTAWDTDSPYFDAKSTPEKPCWWMVDVKFVSKFPQPLTRAELKAVPALADMELLRRGSRLSVQPVSAAQWRIILKLAGITFSPPKAGRSSTLQ